MTPTDLVSDEGLPPRCRFAYMVMLCYMVEGVRELLGLFLKSINPIHKGSAHDLVISQRPHLLKLLPWSLGFQYINFRDTLYNLWQLVKITHIVVSYDSFYFCGINCNFSCFISDFSYLNLFSLFFLTWLRVCQFCWSLKKNQFYYIFVTLFYSQSCKLFFLLNFYYFLLSARLGLSMFFFFSSLRCKLYCFEMFLPFFKI